MSYYAVIDTNVIVSALITKSNDSPPREIVRAMTDGRIIPLYHPAILEEYEDVLSRRKFHLHPETIKTILNAVQAFGVEVHPRPTGEILVDMDDLIFYEVAMEGRDDDAYLVSGNLKHYPVKPFIVSPAEMLRIINGQSRDE